MPNDDRCIGVFDSGIGGLTVVRALQRRLPAEHIVYFGDTARVPYGSKSTQTVTRFSRELCEFLLQFEPKMIVVACNTASAVALAELEALLPVPVIGVVDPGARQAVLLAEGHTIAVVATEATIQSDAYRRAIGRYDPKARVLQKACPLFVPIVEEGRGPTDPIVRTAIHEYLDPILRLAPKVLVLGCTHYPLLNEALQAAAGPDVRLVDSGEQTARAVADRLAAANALTTSDGPGSLRCYVSDNPQRFRELGQRFLESPVIDVTGVSLDQLAASHSSPHTAHA
jgi:glutamate racemase